ncbi:hypothetical protein ACSQ67_015255 [Phaseolus vulgaris]
MVFGEIVRDTCSIGFVSNDVSLDGDKCKGVRGHLMKRPEGIGVGNQGHKFGYATDDTPELTPLSHVLAAKLDAGLMEKLKTHC